MPLLYLRQKTYAKAKKDTPNDVEEWDMLRLHRWLYPEDWPAVARSIKEACGWRCLQCGKQCRRPGEMWLGWEYQLTVAHLDQCYDGPVVNAAALCVACHLKHDAPYGWVARRRHAYIRRQMAGQLEMFAAL